MASFLHVQLLEEEYTFQAPFIGFVEEFCRIQILQESFQFFPLRRRIGVRFQNYVTLLRNVSIHVDFGGKLELQPIEKKFLLSLILAFFLGSIYSSDYFYFSVSCDHLFFTCIPVKVKIMCFFLFIFSTSCFKECCDFLSILQKKKCMKR